MSMKSLQQQFPIKKKNQNKNLQKNQLINIYAF